MKFRLFLFAFVLIPRLPAAYLVPFTFDFNTAQFLSADPSSPSTQSLVSYTMGTSNSYRQVSPGNVQPVFVGETKTGIDGSRVGLGLGAFPSGSGISCTGGINSCTTMFSRVEASFSLLRAESVAVAAFGVTSTNPDTNVTTVYAGQTDVTSLAMFSDIVQANTSLSYTISMGFAYDGALGPNSQFLYRLAAVYLDRGVMTPDGFVAPAMMVSNVNGYDGRMDQIGASTVPLESNPGAYSDSGVFNIAAAGNERILIFGQLLTFHTEVDTGGGLSVGGGNPGFNGARFFNTAHITAVTVSNGVSLNSSNGVDWVNIATVNSEVPEPSTFPLIAATTLAFAIATRIRKPRDGVGPI